LVVEGLWVSGSAILNIASVSRSLPPPAWEEWLLPGVPRVYDPCRSRAVYCSMDGVFLLNILVVRLFSYTPIHGGRMSGFGLPDVADPGGGLDVAIVSSLVFECELVDRGKLEGRLVPFSTRGPSSPELASFSPAELDELTLIRFRDTDLALAPDV
jgi:hypothetical protein